MGKPRTSTPQQRSHDATVVNLHLRNLVTTIFLPRNGTTLYSCRCAAGLTTLHRLCKHSEVFTIPSREAFHLIKLISNRGGCSRLSLVNSFDESRCGLLDDTAESSGINQIPQENSAQQSVDSGIVKFHTGFLHTCHTARIIFQHMLTTHGHIVQAKRSLDDRNHKNCQHKI